MKIDIQIVQTPAEYAHAKVLILEYVKWLNKDLSFQSFDAEINQLDQMYGPPAACLLLVTADGDAVGVAGVRHFEPGVSELKRMYIKPAFRGLGIGQSLLQKAILSARTMGYSLMRLDTDASMLKAIELYHQAGFVEIPPYRFNPYESARYFELTL